MLSREKCVELQKAGWPQEIPDDNPTALFWVLMDDESNEWEIWYADAIEQDGCAEEADKVRCPSTGELIDECLTAARAADDRASTVVAIKDVHGGCEAYADNFDGDSIANTISDDLDTALADLYLKLREKQ